MSAAASLKQGILYWLGKADPFVHLDLPRFIGEVAEVHHRGSVIDGGVQLIARLNDYQLRSGGAQLVIERIAMRFLDDDFGFHTREVGQLLDQALVVAGENAREP